MVGLAFNFFQTITDFVKYHNIAEKTRLLLKRFLFYVVVLMTSIQCYTVEAPPLLILAARESTLPKRNCVANFAPVKACSVLAVENLSLF